MRSVTSLGNTIAMGGVALSFVFLAGGPARAQAPACQDEETVAQSMVQDVAASVDSIRKESESDFESKYHQKGLTNKLTFALTSVDGAVQCLTKASGDTSAAARKDAESKLKMKLTDYRTQLKEKTDPKAAKELIATFDFPAAAVTASK